MCIRFFAACLLALCATLSLARAQAPARPAAVLTLADAPLRLIRGATVYKAVNGAALQKDDILETDAGGAQIEAGPDAIVALGPQTRVLLAAMPATAQGALDVALLQGWVKLMDKGGRATVVTPVLQVSLSEGSTVVRAGPGASAGQDAVFAEDGAQQVARLDQADGKSKPLKLAAEQYAALDPDKPQLAIGRPPRAFIAALPPSFRDRLARAPNPAKAGKVALTREREAGFADVGPWLQAPPQLRKNFVARFKPRLADAEFRKALDHALGKSAEWKGVLHPSRMDDNTLF